MQGQSPLCNVNDFIDMCALLVGEGLQPMYAPFSYTEWAVFYFKWEKYWTERVKYKLKSATFGVDYK